MIYFNDKPEMNPVIDFGCNHFCLDNIRHIRFKWISGLNEIFHGHCFEFDTMCFNIIINDDLTLNEKIKTIFHELTHVRQFVDDKKYWDGSGSYYNHPSEIEAENNSHKLFKIWTNNDRCR